MPASCTLIVPHTDPANACTAFGDEAALSCLLRWMRCSWKSLLSYGARVCSAADQPILLACFMIAVPDTGCLHPEATKPQFGKGQQLLYPGSTWVFFPLNTPAANAGCSCCCCRCHHHIPHVRTPALQTCPANLRLSLALFHLLFPPPTVCFLPLARTCLASLSFPLVLFTSSCRVPACHPSPCIVHSLLHVAMHRPSVNILTQPTSVLYLIHRTFQMRGFLLPSLNQTGAHVWSTYSLR